MGIVIKKINFLITFFCFHLLVSFSFCGDNDLIEINRVAAQVGNEIVTWGQIKRAMAQFNFLEDSENTRARELVDGKVDRLLATNAFDKKGMVIPDSFIEHEYNKKLITEFRGDRRLFRDFLKSKGQTITEYKNEIKEEIVYQHMLASRKRRNADVSPASVETYYNENLHQFKTDSKVKISEIVFSQIADEPKTVLLQQAESVYTELKNGKSFEELASSNGQSLYRERSGDWGVLISENEIRSPEIKEQAFKLKEGEGSKPFEVELPRRGVNGNIENSGKVAIYIIKIDKKVHSGIKPLNEVRNSIESQIAKNIESKEQRKWLSNVKEKSYVRITLPE